MIKRSQKSLAQFIDESERKLSEIVNDAEQRLDEIQIELDSIATKKSSADQELGKIQQERESANKILSDLRSYHKEFESLKEQLEDEDNGMEVNLEWSQKKKSAIEQLAVSSEDKLSEIKKIQSSTEKLKEEIAEHERVTSGYREKIQATYDFMNGQGLAHSFYERKVELEKEMKLWRRCLFLSLALLFAGTIWLVVFPPALLKAFSGISSWLDFAVYFALRLILLSPVIFTVWYSLLQYSRERKDISQYAFKGGVAKALENYTDLLTDKFQDKAGERHVRNSILEFTISCMKDIYKNPHDDIDMSQKTNFKGVGETIEDFRENVTKPIGEISEDLKKATNITELPK